MRGASHGLVGLTLACTEHFTHATFKHVQSAVIIHLALHNIELRTARSLLRVHLVSLARCSQCAFLVEVVVLDFGRDSITWVETTVFVLSTLNHKLFDDAMERRSIVPTLVHKFDEIVTVVRSVVIQFGFDGAHTGLDDYDRFFLCSFLCLAGQTDQYQSSDNQFFHFYSYFILLQLNRLPQVASSRLRWFRDHPQPYVVR